MPPGSSDIAAQIHLAKQKLVELEKQTASVGNTSKQVFTSIGQVAKDQLQTLVVGVLNDFEGALLKAIKAHELSAASLGKALKHTVADTLKAIGEQATVKAAFEVAEGVAALAGVATAGLAGPHFVAAAEYLSVALLAGAAAGAMSSSSSGASTAANSPKGTDSGQAGGGSVRQNVTIVGGLDADAAEALNDQLHQAREKRDLA